MKPSLSIKLPERDTLKRKLPLFLWSVFRLILLIGISYVILYPVIAKLALAFMDRADLNDVTVKWLPRHFTLDNIKTVSKIVDYIPALFRTVGVCLVISLIEVFVCALSAYGFARFHFKGRGLLFALVIGTLVVPPQTYIVQLYNRLQSFDIFGIIGLFNGGEGINLLGGVVPFIVLGVTGMGIRCGLYIFIMRQTFRALPKEIEEAAKVDGARTWRTFWQIMLPNAVPTIVVCFVLAFVWQWNDTFYTGLFSPSLNTLAQIFSRLNVLITNYLGSWSYVSDSYTRLLCSVGSLLAIAPIMVFYAFCQKAFVQGTERSGLVG